MLRRNLCRYVWDGPARALLYCRADTLVDEFDKWDDFHKGGPGWLDNLYTEANSHDPFSMAILKESRLCISGPVCFRGKCLRVPFLVDTGCPATRMHHKAISQHWFNGELADEAYETGIPDFQVGVLKCPRALLNRDDTGVFKHLNVLGMDFLLQAIPDMPEYFSTAISKFQPPISLVEVTGENGVFFGVKPEKAVVWALKKAIKVEIPEELTGIAFTKIIIKAPDGKVMGDKDALHARVEYVFELPK